MELQGRIKNDSQLPASIILKAIGEAAAWTWCFECYWALRAFRRPEGALRFDLPFFVHHWPLTFDEAGYGKYRGRFTFLFQSPFS